MIDLACPVTPSSEPAHLRQASSGESIVLRPGLDELDLDQALMDREHGKRVDLLVGLDQLAPGPVVIEAEEWVRFQANWTSLRVSSANSTASLGLAASVATTSSR